MSTSTTGSPPTEQRAPVGPPLIGALLRMPWESVRERMLMDLHQSGFEDLVAAHLNVLQYPGPENRRPSDLASDTRMSKQAMNYLLGQMEGLGYLRRRDDPDDQRSKRIRLTDRGHAAIRTIRRTVGEIEAEWERALGAPEFARLRDLLTRLGATAAAERSRPARAGGVTTSRAASARR
jgi:DNA-binding MarR family transcriptional regulator